MLGWYEATICCGWPDPLYGDEAACTASPRACRRCGGPQRLAMVMDDLGEVPLRLIGEPRKPLGVFVR